MSLLAHLLRFFYRHLYHGLAFTYDLVAWTVSFGQWTRWIQTVLPYIEGTRVLELGHGPGHLQRIFADRGLAAAGLDESAQMGRIARARLIRSGHARIELTRGIAQSLPFPNQTFDSIVATFPAEYIFEAQTASEAHRVLRYGGRLIVLPVAWPKNRFLSWLYRVTNESPSEAVNIVTAKIGQPFERAGFAVRVETHEVKSSVLLLIVAEKPSEENGLN
jgi:ubiquinone/menaquinone biosynthesis C-methylase UbiE